MVANTERGEFDIKIGKLEITISPSYGRIARATAAVGNRAVQALLFAMAGEGVGIVEQATYIEQLSKPRIKSDVIGKALAKVGALKAGEVMGEILKELAKGTEDDGDELPMPSDDDDEDDPGK